LDFFYLLNRVDYEARRKYVKLDEDGKNALILGYFLLSQRKSAGTPCMRVVSKRNRALRG